jgi:hypothetical protein
MKTAIGERTLSDAHFFTVVRGRWGFRALLTSLFIACLLIVPIGPAGATGTVRVQQRDGSVRTYTNVRIRVHNDAMSITSSDGKGTIVIGKAACSKVAELIRCLPYDATLEQNDEARHIALQTGTVWLNPTDAKQQLSHSSTQLPPHGVLLAVRTKAGTYVSLTGVVDEIQK